MTLAISDAQLLRAAQMIRDNGGGPILDAALEGAESLCNVIPALKSGGKILTLQATGRELPAAAGHEHEDGACTQVERTINEMFFKNCQKVPVAALRCALVQAINQRSWPQFRNILGKMEAYFTATGFAGAGITADGQNTTVFNPAFATAPGQSIMLRVEARYALPFIPGCFWGTLSFTNNNNTPAEVNYTFIQYKFWVGRRDATSQSQLYQWSDDVFMYGSRFRCGDACTRIPISNPTMCDELNIVGPESALYMQIDNLSAASESISGQQLVVEFGGLEDKCCRSCAVGGSCSCKGKH